MMNEHEIQNELNRLAQLCLDRQIGERPSVNIKLNANVWPQVEVEWFTDKYDLEPNKYKWDMHRSTDGTVETAFTAAQTFIYSLPTLEQRKARGLRESLARSIELSREAGIETFINPLEELMKKLSENAIEDHRTPIGKEIDDEIPF